MIHLAELLSGLLKKCYPVIVVNHCEMVAQEPIFLSFLRGMLESASVMSVQIVFVGIFWKDIESSLMFQCFGVPFQLADGVSSGPLPAVDVSSSREVEIPSPSVFLLIPFARRRVFSRTFIPTWKATWCRFSVSVAQLSLALWASSCAGRLAAGSLTSSAGWLGSIRHTHYWRSPQPI